MRFAELFDQRKKLRTFVAKVKLRQPSGAYTIIDTTVQARNQQVARQLLRKQYGGQDVVVGSPKELK